MGLWRSNLIVGYGNGLVSIFNVTDGKLSWKLFVNKKLSIYLIFFIYKVINWSILQHMLAGFIA